MRLQRRLRRWLIRGLLMLILGGVIVLGMLAAIILRYGATDRARPADVIIVLGGGEIGTTRRARHAAALYRQGYAPYVLCDGSIVEGETISEAERCALVLQDLGMPEDAIVLEHTSLSTEENAIQAAAILKARGWRDAVLVSDNFHLWRAHWLFEAKGVHVWTSPAQATTGSLPVSETAYAVLREIAATGWYVGKSLLGSPDTRLGQ